jgi:hypothetical protein
MAGRSKAIVACRSRFRLPIDVPQRL